jgi:hypothetical protein
MSETAGGYDHQAAILLGQIVRAAHWKADAEAGLREAVAAARSESVSWAEIGRALGVSAQAAHDRFGKRSGRSGAEVRMMVAGVPKSPKGTGNIDQSKFKASLAIRLEAGETKREAVEHASSDVRASSPNFLPILPDGFLD